MSILLYGCTIWKLIKRIEKKLDRNCTRKIQILLKKSWKQHPTKQQLYSHLPSISKTIQIRWTRHVRHCWRSKDKLVSDILLWTPTHGCASVGQPARTYLQQLFAIQDAVWKACQEQWMKGMDGKRKSKKPVLGAWLNDDSNKIYFPPDCKFVGYPFHTGSYLIIQHTQWESKFTNIIEGTHKKKSLCFNVYLNHHHHQNLL